MAKNVQVTKMGNFEMAKAADRILKFREDNTNGKISTKYSKEEDGRIVFRAYVWKDKADFLEVLKSGVSEEIALLSADGDATAYGEHKAKKDFEKLETIAVGRALAYIGYLTDGQVASTEEMEKFHEYKEEKSNELAFTAIESISEAKTLDELKTIYTALDPEARKVADVVAAKDAKKEELTNG